MTVTSASVPELPASVFEPPLHDVSASITVAPARVFISPTPDVSADTVTTPSASELEPAVDDFSPSLLDIMSTYDVAAPQPCRVLPTPEKNDEEITSVFISPTPDVSANAVTTPCVLGLTADALSPSFLNITSAGDIAASQICSVILTPENNHIMLSNEDAHGSAHDLEKKKRHQKCKFRNSCIDFVSDEDLKDFSDGSSDNWTAKESESSSDEETCKNKRKKKKKTSKKKSIKGTMISKRRVEKPNKQKQQKKSRDEGKAYTTKSGKEVPIKSLKENPCVEGKCGRGCYKIPEERRKSLFAFYWTLDPQRRRDWIVRCAKAIPIKRQKTKQDISRRQITYEYYLNDGEDHIQICQQFLLKTLDITQKFLLYTVSNANEGMGQVEKRHPNAPVINESIKTFARDYIENLPAVPSHYCRKESTCVYLPQEFKNLSNLYRLYCKECRSQEQSYLSEATFTKIFREEFNIRFHTPKKDKCSLCVAYENNSEKNPTEIEKMKEHNEEKKATYRRFKLHQNLQDNKTLVCSFDLQKVLNTPYGESMLLYYSRKYAVYNLTMYESGTQNVSCYIWGECDGKRGGNEIATCLYKYLREVDERAIKNVLLYCDSCSGQNKNRIVLAAINHFLHISKNIEVVQINYLLPGHTYMPVDSVHAVIEKEVKNLIVWSPDQWPTYIESARKRPKPYNVNVIEHSDFINWNTITEETFTTSSLKEFKMKDIRVATFKKNNLKKVEIKCTMKDDAQIYTLLLFVKIFGKGKGRGKGKRGREQLSNLSELSKTLFDLPQLYKNRLFISKAKANDLQRLCQKNIIPRRFHDVYYNLPTADDVKDTLLETDEDDSEID